MKKRLFLFVTILMLMFGTQAVSAVELGTGLAEPEVIDLPSSEIPESVDRETATQSEQAVGSEWDKYTNYYYYNQLDDSKKAVWDELDAMCKLYISGTDDVPNTYTNSKTGEVLGLLEMVSLAESMDADEVLQLWSMFVYANPQYYFLKNTCMRYTSNGECVGLALVVYDAFWDGGDRAVATEKVEAQLATWQAEIDACATEAAKLQKMQDLICAKVTYDNEAAAGNVDEDVSFSQSPYSVLCGETTVCAGYADTFYMLCNASGIDAVSVTSPNHQWNKVRINDSWYNFDVTWDDNYTDSWGYPVYRYYGRSDAMYDTDIDSNNASNIAAHQEEDYWDAYLPLCTLDSSPDNTFKTPGTFASISAQTATPEIIVSYVGGEPQVTLKCATEDAMIYYTVDETNPSVAQSKSYKYCNSFASELDVQVRAIAVCDAHLDSAVASKTIELEKYPITYALDGGVNHADNPSTYTIIDAVTLQEPTKAGYKFGGWFSDVECLQPTDTISVGSTGERAFYAKWTSITYSISYDGNGATAGSVSGQDSCEYDTYYTLAKANYSREGYTFMGWNTEADGTGTPFFEEESVSNLTVVDESTVILYAQWKPITYMITFEGNGETDGVISMLGNCEYDVSYTLPENNYRKTGYTFVAWNIEPDGSGKSYADMASVKNLTTTDGTEIVLYAQWRVNTYSISYDGNGATGGNMSGQSGCEYGTTYALSGIAYEKTGYKFVGWNTQEDGYGDDYADEESVSNLTESDGEVITLYAQWSPISYSIVYDGNGATGGTVPMQSGCVYDMDYPLASNNFERKGYTFARWNTEADGSGIAYEEVDWGRNLSETDGDTVTLYAQWIPITYHVVYDSNGDTAGAMDIRSECEYGLTFTLDANEYVRNGYTFAGWNTEADGSGESYADGASVKNLTDIYGEYFILYAQWIPITYTIDFGGNGATGGEMEPLTSCEYEKTYLLTENSYERTGYIFGGWNTKANGSGEDYEDGEPVQNLSEVDGATITLYAQWSPITYTVIFDGNGAESGEVANMAGCKYDASYSLEANCYAKKSYAFVGWNTQADGSGTWYADREMVKNLSETDGQSIILYAQWMMISYHIAFDGNGATGGNMGVISDCGYDESYELAPNNFVRTGYGFAGWNTKADGTGEAFADQASVQNLTNEDGATVTLYAQWSPNVYKIAYDGNGATSGSMSAQSCNYDASCALSAAGYKKTGYTFKIWNTKADGSGKSYADKASVKNLAAADGVVITLYAQWTANAYTIKFDGNKATKGSMSAQTLLLYGKSYTLSANKFAKTGYKFKGWNTQKNGKGTSYKNRASVQNLSSVNGEVITLYAQWNANKYHVKFNGNGAISGSVKKLKNRSYGKKYKLPANKFKKTGYKFVGWNTKKNGKGKMYKNKAKIKNLTPKNGKTVTLYAQWKKIN